MVVKGDMTVQEVSNRHQKREKSQSGGQNDQVGSMGIVRKSDISHFSPS